MITRIIILSALLFSFTSCNKDDDSSSGGGAPAIRTTSASFVFNGQTRSLEDIITQYTISPEYLEIQAEDPNENSLLFESSPVPDAGTYTTSPAMGFVIIASNELWFCNSGCTVVINEHDRQAKWINISVSGALTDLSGTASATLNSSTIKVFY